MSATFTKTIASYLFLDLTWELLRQDVTNNRSRVKLTLKLRQTGNGIWFSAPKSGVLQGSSFTYTGGFSGTGTKTLQTREIWVNHNSDGKKTQNFSATFDLNITYSGSYRGRQSVSGDVTLTTIPRASTLSAFSFASHLKPSTAVNLNYTIDRKSGSFRHEIQLRDGSHVIRTWDNVSSNGSTSVQLSTANVNSLLNRMSSVTTRSLTLRVRTRSGVNGGWIGSAVTRNATATVHADVKPTVGAVTLSQTGNKVSAHTLQGFSKINAKFTRTAGYGASISSSSIQVRRRSGGADSQTINSNDGTTSKAVSLNGLYEARGTARDSRGRTTNTAWATITVTAYSAPTITNFSAVRNGSTATTVNISRGTTHTVLGTSNHLTYTIQRRQGTGAWTNVNAGATGTITTSGATGSATSTGNSVTSSYDFRIVVIDKLGRGAESILTVSTQRVVLDIHQNEGVGIGKVHERGVLDVNGDILADGTFQIVPNPDGSGKSNPIQIYSQDPNGHGYIEYYGSDGNRKSYVGFGSRQNNVFTISNQNNSHINILGTDLRINDTAVASRGSNSRGQWTRFYDGTQICWYKSNSVPTNPTHRSEGGTNFYRATYQWDFPMSFTNDTIGVSPAGTAMDRYIGLTRVHGITSTRASIQIAAFANFTAWTQMTLIAVGRWK